MGRKQIRDKNTRRVSFELLGKNCACIDNLVEEYDTKFGTMMNIFVDTFANISPQMKADISNFCRERIEELIIEKPNKDNYLCQEIENDINHYKNIYRIINDGKEYSGLISVRMKDAHIEIPYNWIMVNLNEAKNCKFAHVLECKHCGDYGIPHFIMFSNHEGFITNEFHKKFVDYCCEKWINFKADVLDKQVEPIYDNNSGTILNSEEYDPSPAIGIFKIPVLGPNEINQKKKYPFEAVVITD